MCKKNFWPSMGIFIPVVLMIIYFIWIHPTKPLPEIEKETLETIEIKAYEAFMERSRLLISLATALIGAIGLILMWEKKREIEITNFQKSFIIMSVLSAGFSIYLGYITYCRTVEFLANKMFNFKQFNPYLRIPIDGQFWTFLFSILCFGIFIFIDIFVSKNNNQE